MLKFITKVFGTKSDRDLKAILPLVKEINAEYDKLRNLSDDQIRAITEELKGNINSELADVDAEIAKLNQQVEDDKSLDLHQKDAIYNQVDALEEDRNKKLEDVLMTLLPKAFAVVKETSRRLSENKELRVTATQRDRERAAEFDYVEIEGDQSVWKNTWTAAGTDVEWNMVHYDVQLIGGVVLHQGKIAEMATGEGKTLVATLPAYLNALAARGVHIVTVNDYLAKRDSEWMAPLFEFHGMRVDCIDKYQPHSPGRVAAYKADITYGTNNEFGFDYLRDNMSTNPEELVQSKHHFAMIDEVDSVLIDDARTPLIISGPVPDGDKHEFFDLKPRIAQLVDEQKKIAQDFLTDAKKLIKDGKEKEGGLALFRSYRALPKNKPLIKFLGEMGMKQILKKTEDIYIAENNKLMPQADEPLFFTIDEKTNSVELTDKGIQAITQRGEDSSFFILPDISIDIDAIEKSETLSYEEKAEQRDQLIADYSQKTQRIHTVSQLLKAYCLFEKDTEYVVMDSKVKIVDEQTGRIMDGRRYSDGLHQAIEAKENVKIEKATQTYATITLQNYFRMYHKLCGMTGTAETEAGEFWDIYKLDVVVIPTNRDKQRDDRQDKVYKTVREKFNAVIEETGELVKQGRPVLIGTTSVEISEIFSRMLKLRNIKHQVLNAKQHAKEADVVAEAGKPGTVTIATNMAGRGTDIKLTPEAKAAGGLAIIGTERHESRRVDRQLRGRAGRQGDPGTSQFYVCLEDNLMRLFGSDRISKIMDRLGLEDGEVIQHSMITKSIERAQRKVEENNFGIRKRLLEYDDVMNSQREVIYKKRRNALFGDRLELDVENSIFDLCESLIDQVKISGAYESFNLETISVFGFSSRLTVEELSSGKAPVLTDKLYKEAFEFIENKDRRIAEKTMPIFKNLLETKGATVTNVAVPFTDGNRHIRVVAPLDQIIESNGKALTKDLKKYVSLSKIDTTWTDHLRNMDDLKQTVQNATYEQKDPLLIYKFEGFELFQRMIFDLNKDIAGFLYKADIHVQQEAVEEAKPVQQAARKYEENKQNVDSALNTSTNGKPQEKEKVAPLKSEKIYSRNQKVTVQYQDGSVKEDVKFKTVEEDVASSRCVVLEAKE